MTTFPFNITGNQAVSLRSFSLFRSAAPVVGRKASSLNSAGTTQHNKNSSLKISSYFYCTASFLILTRSLPSVRQGYYIHNTASFRYLRRLRSTAFQPYLSVALYFFSGCPIRPPIQIYAPLKRLETNILNRSIYHPSS